MPGDVIQPIPFAEVLDQVLPVGGAYHGRMHDVEDPHDYNLHDSGGDASERVLGRLVLVTHHRLRFLRIIRVHLPIENGLQEDHTG